MNFVTSSGSNAHEAMHLGKDFAAQRDISQLTLRRPSRKQCPIIAALLGITPQLSLIPLFRSAYFREGRKTPVRGLNRHLQISKP